MSARKTILVTGCASGIGRNLAAALRDTPHRVMATDVRADALEEVAREDRWPEDRFAWSRLDVTDPNDWDRVVARIEGELGPLDTLINVAGFLHPGWVHDLDVELAERQLDVNIKGVVFGTRYAAARMAKRKAGHIINVASLAALAPIEGIAVYSASKYAVRGFSLASAQELKRQGIAVTLVCPDAVKTPMLDLQRDYEEAAMTFSGGRALEPGEVTAAIFQAMVRRPLEIYLPLHRGLIARFADVFPAVSHLVGPMLRRHGRNNQSRGGKHS